MIPPTNDAPRPRDSNHEQPLSTARRLFAAPIWVSAFRPFFLLASLYVPIVFAASALGYFALPFAPGTHLPPGLWHGHEMIFGFAAALVVGILLTALPSWAGTPEIRGAPLAALAALWLAGRIVAWTGASTPLAAVVDPALFAAVLAIVAPQLRRARNRFFLVLVPVLAALVAADLAWQLGVLRGDMVLAAASLRSAVYALIVLYVLAGGLLTPVFTGNALREKGRGEQAAFLPPLEAAAVASVVLLAALDLAGMPSGWTGSAALACALIHGFRVARWRGWLVADVPLVFVMHVGFAWLVFAFALKAIAELTGLVPEPAWLHAFTVGALGIMALGLMPRVSLRHTGRPPQLSKAMILACSLAFVAALLRLVMTVHGFGPWAAGLAAALWALAFLIYLAQFARTLASPSLARGGKR